MCVCVCLNLCVCIHIYEVFPNGCQEAICTFDDIVFYSNKMLPFIEGLVLSHK